MKALVARDGHAQIEDRPIPTPGPDDVVVRTTAASMCSADPAQAGGSFDVIGGAHDDVADRTPADIVLGHESVGVVHSVGSGVTGFAVGDRVVSVSTASCGRCENCQRGAGGHCQDRMWGGATLGIIQDGSLAEYFTVPHAPFNLAHIPDAVSDLGAVFVTDSFATGSSAIEGAKLPFGGTVVVVGQGHIGLGATVAARVAGAGLVIAVKNRPGGEEIARAMGADVYLNHTEHDVRSEIDSLTSGVGVDLAVEASGTAPGFELAIEVTRFGGEVSVIGTYTEGGLTDLKIPLQHWGWGVGDKNIRSSFQRPGSERTARLLRLIERNRVDPTPMFTHEYTFADVMQAFRDVAAGSTGLVKPWIRF